MIDQAALNRLTKTSRRAGAYTAVGATLLFAALAYAGWQLARVEARSAGENRRLEELRGQTVTLEAQRTLLLHQLEGAQTALQATEPHEHVSRLLATLPQAAAPPGTDAVAQLTPLFAVTRPRASAVPDPSSLRDAGRQLYDFSIWVEVPPDRLSTLASVSYLFDDPSFRKRTQSSSNASDGFKVQYQGWGCLTRIQITLVLRDSTTQPLDFNMCNGIGWAAKD